MVNLTAAQKRAAAAKSAMPTGLYDLDKILGKKGREGTGGTDDLDQFLRDEQRRQIAEIKGIQVEEIKLKAEKRVKKLRKDIEKGSDDVDSNSSEMPRISVQMAQQIAKLPPEERDKVIETYAMFSSIAKGKGDSMLPLLIGFSKTNPGTPQVNMLDYAKAMGDQLKTGIDLARSFQEKEKPSNAMEFMKVMKDLVIEGVRNPILQAMERNQPQPGVFEQLITNPETFGRLKELGIFSSNEPRTGSTNVDLEIEKLRGERQLEITKLNLDMKKSMMEIDAKDRRSDNMLALLAPLSAIVAGPVAQRMQQLGEQQAVAHVPPSQVPATGGTTILLRCNCGYEGPMTFPGAPPANGLIPCPSCGIDLLVGGSPPGKT